MTSRAAVGTQQPLQAHNALGGWVAQPPQAARAAEAKKPVLAVDSTMEDEKQRAAETKDMKSVTSSTNIIPSTTPNDVSAVRAAASDRQSATGNTIPPLPFPPRPGQYNVEGHGRPLRTGNEHESSVRKREARSQSQEPPPESLQLPHHIPLDYYPWSHDHAEDTLSDQTIKSGFQNKPQVTNETNNSALKPSFKPFKATTPTPSTAGPHTYLSSLFTAVLEKRQSLRRITGPSTAKAPPRVSLTSSRREAWLQDLSNPNVPLKKLNRTIPFGITGKVLLEQCLNKNIPIARAVWVCKAVGINELRAYKRKGTTGLGAVSGELKWIREWTVNIQQFMESTCDLCGKADFKVKMHYAISLSTNLFAENLLDQEMFVDWLLASAEKVQIERLPLWLLLVQTYWQHLISTQRRGRRLAQCLLSRLRAAVSDSSQDLLTPIVTRIQQLLVTLAVKDKGCLILPEVWAEYHPLLASMVDEATYPGLQPALQELSTRNGHLLPKDALKIRPHSPRKMIIGLLDDANHKPNFDELFALCCKVGNDLPMVASTVLEWAVSIYRSGEHNLYLAVRMLRGLFDKGVDLNPLVISLLCGKKSRTVDFCKLTSLTAELVRSLDFSVGRYCQSLLVRGAVGAAQEGSKSDQQLLALLQELPANGSQNHVHFLRETLLQEAGLPTAPPTSELATIQRIKADLFTEPCRIVPLLPALGRLSCRAKSLVRSWLIERLSAFDFDGDDRAQNDGHSCAVTSQEFFALRDVLEELYDLELLAYLLSISLDSNNADIFTPVVETLEYHVEGLIATGTFPLLLDKLVERYQSLRNKTYLDKPFVSAMESLFNIIDKDPGLQLQLQHDMAQCHQRATLAMCSPASDSAVDVHMSDDLDTDDEIGRILSSGTTMDEQIVARVFKRITSRIDESKADDASFAVRCGQWFTRLRAFDQNTFDNLIQEWMTHTLAKNRWICMSMVPALVGCGCITIATFMQCANYCRASAKSDRHFCAQLELDTLDILLVRSPTANIGDPEVRYKFKLARKKFVDTSTATILSCCQRAIQCYEAQGSAPIRDQFRQLLRKQPASDFLKRACVHSRPQIQDCFCRIPVLDPTGNVADLSKELIQSLLTGDQELQTSSYTAQIRQLFENADELSLPMYQLELLRRIPRKSEGQGMESNQALVVLKEELLTISESTTVWPEMLSSLGGADVQSLCNVAEDAFLLAARNLIEAGSPMEGTDAVETIQQARSIVRNGFDILESLSANIWSPKFATMHERLKDVVEHLSSRTAPSPLRFKTGIRSLAVAECIYRILRLCILIKASPSAQPLQSVEVLTLISHLCTMVLLPALQPFPDLLQFSYDVITYFSDDLSDEQRGHLFQRHSSDLRLSFIFGTTNPQSSHSPQDAWLGLVTSVSSASSSSAAGPTSTPTSSPAQRLPHQRSASGSTPRQSAEVSSQPQQTRAAAPHGPTRTASSQGQHQKQWNPPVPFPLRRWEVLPDAGTVGAAAGAGAGGNDTSISLALFGARRVG